MGIAAFDLSITATGVCGSDGHLSTISPRHHGDWRLPEIAVGVRHLVAGCDLVVIEDLPPIRAHALGILGMVHGAVRTLLITGSIPYALVTPGGLKKYATGKGTATKPDMRMELFKRAGLDVRDDNQVDAWWLRAMALDHYGRPLAEMPTLNRSALNGVQWPELAR